MTGIIALCGLTGGSNLTVRRAELEELGLVPGSFSVLSGAQMQAICQQLQQTHGSLPLPNCGGSVANTADLIARLGISCGIMAVGGNDPFGRAIAANCQLTSLQLLTELVAGQVTGFDFYLDDETADRTIILTHGANAQLGPAYINKEAIVNADLLLLDGSVLTFGPNSAAAMTHAAELAEQAGVPFVLTLCSAAIVEQHRDFFKRFAPKAQMVAGNRVQTAVLLGLELQAPLQAVKVQLAESPLNALVTLDADGAFAWIQGQAYFAPALKVRLVDSVGAGDNFLGGFLAARHQGLTIPQALRVGHLFASKVIQYTSARLPLDVDIPGLWQEALQAAHRADD